MENLEGLFHEMDRGKKGSVVLDEWRDVLEVWLGIDHDDVDMRSKMQKTFEQFCGEYTGIVIIF